MCTNVIGVILSAIDFEIVCGVWVRVPLPFLLLLLLLSILARNRQTIIFLETG